MKRAVTAWRDEGLTAEARSTRSCAEKRIEGVEKTLSISAYSAPLRLINVFLILYPQHWRVFPAKNGWKSAWNMR